MIRSAFALALLFTGLLIVESSGMWVFTHWVATIPLMIIAGLLVMQRVGVPEGVAWFCALAFLRIDIVSAVIACTGPSLTLRVFSTRSLYALFGIGMVSHAAGIGVLFIIATLANTVFHATWNIAYGTLWLQEILLLPGLNLGMNGVRWFEHNIRSRVRFTS